MTEYKSETIPLLNLKADTCRKALALIGLENDSPKAEDNMKSVISSITSQL